MARPKGSPKLGGRKKGTPNKPTRTLQETLNRLGCNPIEGLAMISLRRVSCGTCIDKNLKPTGHTKFNLPDGKHAASCRIHKGFACTCEGIAERPCQSCFGTKWEKISVETKLRADTELASYVEAKRKAIEVSGTPDGQPLQSRVVVEYVNVPEHTSPPTPSPEDL